MWHFCSTAEKAVNENNIAFFFQTTSLIVKQNKQKHIIYFSFQKTAFEMTI